MIKTVLFATLFASVTSDPSSFCTQNAYPKNCKDLQDRGVTESGIYSIKPDFASQPFLVYCDMNTKDGGWLYIMNRFDGSQNFSLPWKDYKYGFGNTAREFWLGLEHIHQLTVNEVNELLVELVDWFKNKYHFHYKAFNIGAEELDYSFQVIGGFTGDSGDSLTEAHGGVKFSTIDRDNDEAVYSCSEDYGRSGWWFKSCYVYGAHLTGTYKHPDLPLDDKGIAWTKIVEVNSNFSDRYSFKEARMMIRPVKGHALVVGT